MDRASRANNFDFLRLFGAILVLYGHSYALTGSISPGFAANGVATVGVKIFFSISGYLVTLSWLRDPDVLRFFRRRIVRIFPALVVVVVLSAFLLGPLVTTLPLAAYVTNPATFDYLWSAALNIRYFLPGVFGTSIYPGAVNGSLWSIPAEWLMYLLTPAFMIAVAFAIRRLAFFAITLAVTVASLWLCYFVPRNGQFVVYGTDLWTCLSVAPYFLIGASFAVCAFDRFLNIYAAFMGLFALSIFDMNAALKEAMLMAILPYAALSFGSGPNPLHRHMRGVDISYGAFLWGFPVQQTLSHFFGAALGPWSMFLAASAITAPIALASWVYVEKPMLRLKTTLWARGEPAPVL